MDQDSNHDLEFSLLETSLNSDGFIAITNESGDSNSHVPSSLIPLGIPPVVKSVEDQAKEYLYRYLQDQSIYCADASARTWPRKIDYPSLYSMDLCPLKTSIQVERNQTNGQLLGFYEAEGTTDDVGADRKAITLQGLKESSTVDKFLKGDSQPPDMCTTDFLSTPPGFKEGMRFQPHSNTLQSKTSFNVSQLLFDNVLDEQIEENDAEKGLDNEKERLNPDGDEQLEEQLSSVKIKPSHEQAASSPTENIQRRENTVLEEVWAEKVDVNLPVEDFHKKIPNMAHKYPFKLDPFQELAILRLENNQSVFVAAHTSAGKTVVAEYAIALTAKHVTRVIYTSPIKVLSNQKFRDFKQTFSDVGLITGDVQINPEAFCLIMTTEILRSMLYNGSDVIRDLEWVIFDEVHYINDAERGVVWEEVLIMLPRHCHVILLSATVPNAFEFANWIGRTRQRKIHVITTLKRPVPLNHYLYTGNSTKTSNELFMIVDGDRKFHKLGYKAAVDAKNERMSKHAKSFGAKQRTGGGAGADKNVWLSLVTRLRKTDQLPVVAFTFSRRRCDENALSLGSLDLTSTSEKREIKLFFNKCIQRLKGSDKMLPQVLQMSTLLERGLGVHHSGVLPILKEVVEMLFAKGLVKLLFATETFAMGVNMPARTVVFDSIRKHDGVQMRNLLPGEYIQMAGRAGRRGLDATGTVIILCKGDVPEVSELHTMMLGRVTQLQSQFRLTYGMILNLLRVEQFRVEEVMKKSFSEFNTRKNSKAQEEELKNLQSQLDDRIEVKMIMDSSDYEQYYLHCKDLMTSRCHVHDELLSGSAGSKVMAPGRVLVLALPRYQSHVAVVLKANSTQATKIFQVLVLTEGAKDYDKPTAVAESWSQKYLLKKKLFKPDGKSSAELIDIKAEDILYVTSDTIRVQGDTIISDCKRRQIPRFKKDKPNHVTMVATQQLLNLVDSHPDGLREVDLLGTVGIRQIDLVEEMTSIRSLESSISGMFACVEHPSFDFQIEMVVEYMEIQEKFRKLKYLLSDESLYFLPEYQQRVKVLEELRYIDEGGAVQMKGRVACEISNHELILTELVFENILSNLDPTEIVALLSCCVFQQRIDMDEVSLTPRLKEGMSRILEVAHKIGGVQIACGMREAVEDFVETLKFGLVEVVYEWAKGTSFKDITSLTSVQEGAIVRNIQRLNELCRDVRNAARVIGDPSLYAKMEKCSELVKRDIVFAASLYLQ